MLDLVQIGERIANRRKSLKMSQLELAEKLFVTHQAVSKWENGKSMPTIDVLVLLTKTLDLSIDYLLDHSEIDEFDYERQFKNYPREVVLNKIFSQISLNQDTTCFFYLLNQQERMRYLDLIISKKTCLKIEELWPFLTKQERTFILGNIKSKKCLFDPSIIKHQLSPEEHRILYSSR